MARPVTRPQQTHILTINPHQPLTDCLPARGKGTSRVPESALDLVLILWS